MGEILPSFALSSAFTVSITNGPLLPCSTKARNYFNHSPHKRHYTAASRILDCISRTHKTSILQCEVIRLHTPERYRHTLIWKNNWTAKDTQWSAWIGGIVRTLLTVGVMSKSGLTKSSISLPRSFLHQWTIVRMTKLSLKHMGLQKFIFNLILKPVRPWVPQKPTIQLRDLWNTWIRGVKWVTWPTFD